ncbi:hypothetical protein [Larkinella soli]|uniref:hypothetical protein n=1 Tax=Larkinella soli TaxID=1770527 RepID=UPI001E4962DF|nr:hypothetical protein [Larkinella soli]
MESISVRRAVVSYHQDRLRHQAESVATQSLKNGIWLYFLLLIFEGALRKWVLPGLSAPLLIIRDPVALWLLYQTWKRGYLPSSFYLYGFVFITCFSILTAVTLGHGNMFVALFGARILLLHFPLMFVIGRIFYREDVVKIGKITLWITIPMTVLLALQFYSPQTAWVNRGVGGDMEGAGFAGAMGFYRPPGTFSFTNGTTLFYSFAAAFIVYFWLGGKGMNRLVLSIATACLLMAIPLSISRGLFFSVAVTVLFALLSTLNKPEFFGKFLLAGIIMAIAIGGLSFTPYFQTATEAFFTRFESSSKVEGGLEGVLLDRYLGGLIGALGESGKQPFFGYGLGLGTNVGSLLLTGGVYYLISEGEWGRLVGEMGPLLGIFIIFLRISLCVKMSIASYQKMRAGDLLPWLLLSFGLLVIPQGQLSQPTALGFCVMIGGLLIASFHTPKRTARRG